MACVCRVRSLCCIVGASPPVKICVSVCWVTLWVGASPPSVCLSRPYPARAYTTLVVLVISEIVSLLSLYWGDFPDTTSQNIKFIHIAKLTPKLGLSSCFIPTQFSKTHINK